MIKNNDFTNAKMSIYNWMMNPDVPDVTSRKAKKLIDEGKIAKGKEKTQLISFEQLQNWGIV